jgi:hypothetical protein
MFFVSTLCRKPDMSPLCMKKIQGQQVSKSLQYIDYWLTRIEITIDLMARNDRIFTLYEQFTASTPTLFLFRERTFGDFKNVSKLLYLEKRKTNLNGLFYGLNFVGYKRTCIQILTTVHYTVQEFRLSKSLKKRCSIFELDEDGTGLFIRVY